MRRSYSSLKNVDRPAEKLLSLFVELPVLVETRQVLKRIAEDRMIVPPGCLLDFQGPKEQRLCLLVLAFARIRVARLWSV